MRQYKLSCTDIDMGTVKVRRDLVEKGLSVPVGDLMCAGSRTYKSRWKGEDFEIFYRGKWRDAMSVDFAHYYGRDKA